MNAYEDGDEVVLDGFFEENPDPGLKIDRADKRSWFRMLDMHVIGAKPYRWRFNMKTGRTTEGYLDDAVSEFGMINPLYGGKPYRYTWAATLKPEWFLMNGLIRLDVQTGEKQSFELPEGVFLSESPMAPRPGSTEEDDGYVLTFVTDMNKNSSSAMIFAAQDISRGPVAEVALPQRICVGTHSCWCDKNGFSV
jgi:carotenoid cleavage dioxygenase